MDASRVLVLTSHQPIRWGDMDAFGHVNNTVYFRYMEQARIEWMYAQVAAGRVPATGQGPVIVNASCEFLVPLVYPGDVVVRMFVASPGRTSVASDYEIDAGGRRCANGAARIVWVDLRSGRPLPLPEPLRGSLHPDPRPGSGPA